IAYFQRMFMAGGKPIPAIAETYMRLSRSLNLTEIRARIHPGGGQVPVAIEYEYLIQLEEKFFRINRRMLDHPELLREFLELDHAEVKQTLNEACKHSTYRPSREMRAQLRQLDRDSTERITEAFRLADVLEDAVSIVLGRRHSRSDWTIARYFHIVEMFHIQKLRRIVSELHPESSWEILFLSRVDERIERFLMSLLDAGYGRGSRPDETREKIHRMVEDIFSAHSNGSLTTAVLYEMLEFMIRQLQSPAEASRS
ncbi:MAG: NAD-glutamate dehydrogenase, partial [Leptospiraceae bacterium]|nr:NAD-glutamate dehydrogenase [Leptospiraceae bacterium]